MGDDVGSASSPQVTGHQLGSLRGPATLLGLPRPPPQTLHSPGVHRQDPIGPPHHLQGRMLQGDRAAHQGPVWGVPEGGIPPGCCHGTSTTGVSGSPVPQIHSASDHNGVSRTPAETQKGEGPAVALWVRCRRKASQLVWGHSCPAPRKAAGQQTAPEQDAQVPHGPSPTAGPVTAAHAGGRDR